MCIYKYAHIIYKDLIVSKVYFCNDNAHKIIRLEKFKLYYINALRSAQESHR